MRSLAAHEAADCLRLADSDNWSYGDLRRWGAAIGDRLINMGVEPGDRVVVQVDKSPRIWRCIWQRCGSVVSMYPSTQPIPRQSWIILWVMRNPLCSSATIRERMLQSYARCRRTGVTHGCFEI